MPQEFPSRSYELSDKTSVDLSEVDAALAAEIEADKNERRLRPIELGRGRRRSPAQRAPHIYEFLCDEPLRAGDRGVFALEERQCQTEVAGRQVDKEDRPTVLLRLQMDLGDIAPRGIFIPDPGPLQKLRQHLTGLPNGFNSALASRAIGASPSPATVTVPPDLEWLSERLNEDQLRAVAKTFSHPVSLTWGPPGTGKTRTLVATAEAQLREGNTVLIAAPTHGALDRILEVAEPWLRTIDGYGEGAVLRLGQIRCPDLAARIGSQIDVDEVQDRLVVQREEMIKGLAQERVHAATPEERDAIDRRLSEAQRRPVLTAEALMHHAKVIFATTHQAYHSRLSPRPGLLVTKSTVLVDEAGMVSLPLLFATAGLARARVALFGDFRQLPPVVKSGKALATHWLGGTGFDGHEIPAAIATEADPPHLTTLTEQHRMAPSISAFVSEASYASRLRTSPSLRRLRGPISALSGGALHLLDTTPLFPTAGFRNGSRHNEVHAQLIAEVVRSLPDREKEAVSTLVLTPFRAQVVALNNSLRRAGLPPHATTVHRAQGAEADIVIVDLVETDPRSISVYLRAQGPDDDGARLLNVAVSRAKRAVIVVAAVEPLLRSPATGRWVKTFLSKLQEDAITLDPWTYWRPDHPRAA